MFFAHSVEEVWECSVTMGELAAMDGCDGTLVASNCCETPVTVLRRYHHHNCSNLCLAFMLQKEGKRAKNVLI
ncbi:hypothetical protein Taro_035272 [Colocasia esculenta]|uniref:Uncharacterized protein n=1 Tax=Colocasia esculenta TaxID=4460 RepID=A0A843WI54_COLES|nr:hypothetical protein [Colocasia esculenta]